MQRLQGLPSQAGCHSSRSCLAHTLSPASHTLSTVQRSIHQQMFQQPLPAGVAAAAGRQAEQQTDGPPRQRRSRQSPSGSSSSSGYDNSHGGYKGSSSSSSSSARSDGRGGRGGSSSSSSTYEQQASWQQRRRPPARRPHSSGDEEFDAEDPLDREFMDPNQAAKLRKLMKAKGSSAVVDKRGFVRQDVLEADAADEASSSSGRQRRTAGAGISSSSGSASREAQPALEGAAGSEPGRSRLFEASQLQAAVPGSGGAIAALPIVRPDSSVAARGSVISPDRAAVAAAAAAAKSRAGAASASGFYSGSSWRELGASQQVQDAVASIGFSRPSHVQAEAYKALRSKSGFRHVALADQAGSGKTLAYLLPLLQQLKEREEQLGEPATQPNSPSIIILTPTTELAQQVGRVVRALSQAGLRVRSAVMTGGQQEADRRSKTLRTQVEMLDGGFDVLVATPGRVLAHHERGSLNLSNTAALVMDEVDVLAGGEVDYTKHIAPLRAAAPPAMRCVLVSATLPQHTFDELQEMFMGLGAAFGPGLHRTAQGVVEELIDCSGGDEISLQTGTARKLEALMAALDRNRSPRTVVFCNKIETCRVVENALRRQKPTHEVLVYHEAIRDDMRSRALNAWLAPPAVSEQPSILVCTDRTSRGIDSMWCEHVVLFEFPRDPSEYVRRVGRTARGAGGKGVVSVLVLGKQVPLAKDILERNREGVPVHRIPRLWSDK